jgi:hypothetical protein
VDFRAGVFLLRLVATEPDFFPDFFFDFWRVVVCFEREEAERPPASPPEARPPEPRGAANSDSDAASSATSTMGVPGDLRIRTPIAVSVASSLLRFARMSAPLPTRVNSFYI